MSTVTTPRGTTRTQTQYLALAHADVGKRDTIVDLVSGKITILDNRRKEYSRPPSTSCAFPRSDRRGHGRATIVDQSAGATGSVTIEKGTGGKKVAGYDTEPHILTMGEWMRVEVFTTTALEPPARYYDARKVLYASMGPMARRFDRVYDEMKKIKGFPLATTFDYRMRVARRQVSTGRPRSARADPGLRVRRARLQEVESPFGADRPPRAPLALKPLVSTSGWPRSSAPRAARRRRALVSRPRASRRDAYPAGHSRRRVPRHGRGSLRAGAVAAFRRPSSLAGKDQVERS